MFPKPSYDTSLSALSQWRRIFSEFIGTLLFIYAVSASAVIPATYLHSSIGIAALVTALIQGFALIVIVAMFSGFSGSHFNPAITFMLIMIRSISPLLGILYIIAQLSGAICGAGLFRASVPLWQDASVTTVQNVSLGQAFLIELMITNILLLVVVITSTSLNNGLVSLAPIPIGLAVLIGVLIAKTLTGASMNPARSLGPAVIANVWTNHWLYWIAPLSSAIVISALWILIFNIPRETRVNPPNPPHQQLPA